MPGDHLPISRGSEQDATRLAPVGAGTGESTVWVCQSGQQPGNVGGSGTRRRRRFACPGVVRSLDVRRICRGITVDICQGGIARMKGGAKIAAQRQDAVSAAPITTLTSPDAPMAKVRYRGSSPGERALEKPLQSH
jgi:hypothetical protein